MTQLLFSARFPAETAQAIRIVLDAQKSLERLWMSHGEHLKHPEAFSAIITRHDRIIQSLIKGATK